MKKTTILLPLVVVIGLLGFSSLFIVDERENALVLQFGRVVDVKEEPGLAFKIPLIQEVVTYDDRILSRDIDPLEVTPLDDRRLVVDAFARYRITDVRQFRRANGVGGIAAAESRIDSILRSQTREILGSVRSDEILSADRAALMARIRDGAFDEAQSLGLEIIDVRLKRTDLPAENLDATFARMRAEREREAADQIARGNERAQEIRAGADRQRVEVVSEAQREADIIRGQADARRNAVFAEAYGADEEFFEFYRSLDAYRAALSGNTSTMIMSPDSEFFSYLKSNNPSGVALSPAPATEAAASDEGSANEDGATSSDAGSEPSGQTADEGAEAPEAGNAGGAGNASTMPLDDSATE
ncbi:Modulator of FtsH protease HflC [Pseudooceanicola marinus]|uniref:Modulator of FtsH protease HflC n=1 Tax=Pseudooceanicola marinus TaxID=396013 RepID=A0A1X6YBC0_9RHOB|nr:protease modulator HflC [Pseudooceanicola marinus]PJE33081.1 protease modulator HflC [Pseudooceanicola marinus]SLN15491.1 Modulator of FtsH protease HflC [Pseudooceanicola marinus]